MLTRSDASFGYDPVCLPNGAPPNLFVVIDTEEEFDWGAPLSRANQGVTAIRHLHRALRILEHHGITPTCVIDYPVAAHRDGFEPIKELSDSGAVRIGAHLHPWVNPPFDEPVNRHTSYACNLAPDLEAAKLSALKSEIAEHLGVIPRIYKAGRYGFGHSTVDALERLEFDIDTSINPSMDYSADGGPCFGDFDAMPFFFGARRRLMEIPCTTAYVGAWPAVGPAIEQIASTRAGSRTHVGGICSRLRIAEKLHLSPEHSSLEDMKRLTRTLLARGVRTFALTFHSPSVVPGHTPYVRTQRDLDELLERLDAYCDFFRGELGGTAIGPLEFQETVS
jgi:hypothetical protein